jgi:chemotaxis protein CheD
MSALPEETRAAPRSEVPEIVLFIGGVYASSNPVVVRTLLGSCVAVCLFDPKRCIGGMNHFLLPEGASQQPGDTATRYGVHAMDQLIGALMKLGAERSRLVAKVFGGGHVVGVNPDAFAVPRRNVDFARQFLCDEGMPVLSEDVGGYSPREVRFHATSGRARVRRIVGLTTRARLLHRERQWNQKSVSFGDVTLF